MPIFNYSFFSSTTETNFKSALIFAAFTTLAGLAGSLAGGTTGIYLSLSFTVISSLLMMYYSREIVLWIFRAKEVQQDKDGSEETLGFSLYKMINTLKDHPAIDLDVTPKICIIESEQLNAFATGRSKRHAAVAITKGLLKKALEKTNGDLQAASRLIEAIWCHELGHLVHYDIATNTIASIIGAVIKLLSYKAYDIRRAQRITNDETNANKQAPQNTWKKVILEYGLFYIAIPFTVTLLGLALSRTREYAADDTAAHCGRASDLADALTLLKDVDHSKPKENHPQMEAFSSLMCASLDHKHDEDIARALEDKNIGWGEWFFLKFKEVRSTHPLLDDRIERLRMYKVSV
jgi:heat shock protein HtpX